MAKAKGVVAQKKEGVKKKTSIGMSCRSRNTSKNKSHSSTAKKYRGQGK